MKAATILQALDDPHLLGGALLEIADWRPWRAVLAAAFGLPLDMMTPRRDIGRTRGALSRLAPLASIFGL